MRDDLTPAESLSDEMATPRSSEQLMAAVLSEGVYLIGLRLPPLHLHATRSPALIVLLHAKPAEIRDFLAGTLAGDRTREFTEQLRAAGVPV